MELGRGKGERGDRPTRRECGREQRAKLREDGKDEGSRK